MSMDITVVIPAFNAGSTINRALSSIARQTVRPAQVIVINDGSSDNTAEAVEAHEIQRLLPVQLITILNSGVSSARNIGIRAARNNYIALLDADDEFCPDHLEVMGEAIRVRPDAVVYWSGIERIFDNESAVCQEEIGTLPDFSSITMKHAVEDLGKNCHLIGPSIFTDLIRGNFIPTSSSVIRREIEGNLSLFNEQVRFSEDRLFFLEILGKGAGVFVHQPTVLIHRDGNNTSVTTDSSKSLAHNEKKLHALKYAKLLDSIAVHSNRMHILNKCIVDALRERIYYSSLQGSRATFTAIAFAASVQEFQIGSNAIFIFKNFLRSINTTVKRIWTRPR